MSNYLTMFFVTMFIVAFSVTMMYTGSDIGDDTVPAEFRNKFDERIEVSGSDSFNDIISSIASFETVGGAILGSTAALLLGGSATFIIGAAVLGSFVGWILDYYAIVSFVVSTLPLPVQYFFGGVFLIMLLIVFMRFIAGR